MMKLQDPELLRSRAYIGGQWVGAATGLTSDVINPASGEKLGTGCTFVCKLGGIS